VMVDCGPAASGEVEADLAPDRLVARLHAHLRDAGPHRPEPDDANLADPLSHQADDLARAASISLRADSNCSWLRRMLECRHRLCGKTPAASTGGASCRSSTTASGRIGKLHAQRLRVESCSGSPVTSTTPKIACHTAAYRNAFSPGSTESRIHDALGLISARS